MKFKEILSAGVPLPEEILRREMAESGVPVELLRREMQKLMEVMLEEAEKQYGKRQKTLAGFTGDNGSKMASHDAVMLSEFSHMATVVALSLAESNAAMGRVVACPTGGACGVVPGVMYALKKLKGAQYDELLNSFIVAGGIGWCIEKNATIAGAEGGCQAEMGTAAAMASALLTYYFTESGEKAANAAAIALKSMLGLVCDPVGGYVEVPCVKRNGIAVNIAISAAEMALAGIESVIPFDEVVEAMHRVGKSLPESLRETGLGGLAATPTARKIVKDLKLRQHSAEKQ
ncbi:MAG: L-serine ammonia-lyase, iron-sulfur-dependent, subunit alpha [Euryarchaeota archaeon]|nr:L-serine ammonia-lyase, iron-sulfur-dependent, subunit alpha [Euryarchaeota archaeon]